jgi:hypothetical protein
LAKVSVRIAAVTSRPFAQEQRTSVVNRIKCALSVVHGAQAPHLTQLGRKLMSIRTICSSLTLAALLSACAAPTQPPGAVDHSAHQSSSSGQPGADGDGHAAHKRSMHKHMEEMKSQMALIRKTTDPVERQKLMEEHLKMMEAHMSGMEKMK